MLVCTFVDRGTVCVLSYCRCVFVYSGIVGVWCVGVHVCRQRPQFVYYRIVGVCLCILVL